MAAGKPELALNGGTPVRDTAKRPWPKWPVWDEQDLNALREVLESGTWGCAGKATHVPAFAEEFARFQDARFGVTNTNGTVALEIALRALGLQLGDEVIVPPYTFVATATAVILAGGVPVFADIDPGNYNLDPAAAEAAITSRTRGIIAVHIAGCPADLDALSELARKRGLFLLEDCAQAHAAEWRGRKVGAIGDAGTFSFQSSKNLCAGEGGIVVTNDEGLYQRCWSITNVGRVPQGAFYEHPILGANFRMTEFQASLLRSQMARLPEQTARRWQNAQYLNAELAKVRGIRPMALDPRVTMHAYHLYVFRFDGAQFGGMSRAEFLRALSAEGIPCSAGYVPLYGNSLFRNPDNFPGRQVDYSRVHCPVAERVCADEAIWLTQNLLLGTREDMDDIVEAVAKVRAGVVG
jgi:dTDP-4-amino-4,6-dideoxygalactose transaminase